MSLLACTMLAVLTFAGPPKLPPMPGGGVSETSTTESAPAGPTEKPAPTTQVEPTAQPEAAQPGPPVQRPRGRQVDAPAPPIAEPPKVTTPAAQPAPQPLAMTPRSTPAQSHPRTAPASAGPPTGEPLVVVKSEKQAKRRTRERPQRSASFVLGYRQFWILDGLNRTQSWHMGTMQITPARRYVRVNLLTEVGVEGSEAARDGGRADLLAMQRLGLGLQYPHWVTPFIEFQGGVGAARVELFNRNDLVFVWTLGLDVGAQFAVTRWLFLHTALGWIRPVFRRPDRSIAHDSFAFKVGIGF